MSSERQRQEYVVNESGLNVGRGSQQHVHLAVGVRPVLLRLHLPAGGRVPAEPPRGGPGRAPSRWHASWLKCSCTYSERAYTLLPFVLVNSNDVDGGILWGNWSDDYSDGALPTAWSGSGATLEEFWRAKKVVKYAQCWVFGGTLTYASDPLNWSALMNFTSIECTEWSHDQD